ncbi:FG-GAP-like repeat-containing protein [Pirellulales bacterium]|nr:FG-GAP-like repeat-containing protein [Pirellulales bacterium]
MTGSRVEINVGNGVFEFQGQSLGSDRRNARLGDLDNDGDLDIFMRASDPGEVVWLNDGAGKFDPTPQVMPNRNQIGFDLGDVDGDGDLDAWIVGDSDLSNRVWLNDGSGAFTSTAQEIPKSLSTDVVLADVDGDGDLDALTTSVRSGSGSRQIVFVNQGDGTFVEGTSFTHMSGRRAVAVGDLDSDGDLDAIYVGDSRQAIVALNGDVDLVATLVAPGAVIAAGDVTTYMLTVSNNGPIDVSGAVVETVLSKNLAGLQLENVALLGGAVSTAAAVDLQNGTLEDVVHLPVGSSIIYQFTVTIGSNQLANALANTHFSAVASIATPAGLFDALPQNNRSRQDKVLVISAPQPGGVFVDSGQALGTADSRDVVLGDLDGDGDLDALTATAAGAALWINDNGTFVAGAALGDQDSLSVGLGDLDGDGNLDAIIGTERVGNRVWLNNGNMTFVDTGQRLDDEGTTTIGIADFDGDGDLDFLGGNNGRGDILWLNDGNGTFTSAEAPRDYSIGRLALGDLDGDGDLDVVSTFDNGGYNGSVRIRFSNGDGTFSSSASLNDFAGATGLALGDFDGDGDLDAFVTLGVESTVGPSGKANRVLLNDGAGALSDSGQRLGFGNSQGVTIGDIDNDGDVDAMAVNAGQANQVWRNDGSGHFRKSGPAFGAADAGQAIALGDLDGDGRLDLFVAAASQPNRVYTSLDPQTLADVAITKTAGHVAVVQGSRITYTIVAANHGPQPVSGATVFDSFAASLKNVRIDNLSGAGGAATSQLPGNLTGQLHDVIDLPVGASITYTISADVASDAADSILGNAATITLPPSFALDLNPENNSASDNDLVVLPNLAGTGQFRVSALSELGQPLSELALGDLDGDGDLDAFVVRGHADVGDAANANRVWLNDGKGNLTDSGQALGAARSRTVALSDLDGDGDLDAFEGNDGANQIWINDGTGIFVSNDQLLGNLLSGSVELGDVDGDGDVDAYVGNSRRFGGGAFDQVWLNNGLGQFSAGFVPTSAFHTVDVQLGDLDGDGDLDALVAPFRGSVQLLLNDGRGAFHAAVTSISDDVRGPLVLGDIDNDGDLDALVAVEISRGRNLTRRTQVLLNGGSADFAVAGTFAAAVVSDFALSDFDGDGDLDAVTANYSSDSSRIWVNDGAGNFSPGQVAPASLDGAAVAVGDLDGDGDPDILIGNYNSVPLRWLNNNAAQLVVDVASAATSISVGETTRYTIRVENNGEARAVDARLVSQLAPQLVSGAITGIQIDGDAASSISLGPLGTALVAMVDLAPGASITYTVEGLVSEAAVSNSATGAMLNLTATVATRSSEVDQHPQDNQDQHVQLIALEADAGHGEFTDSGQRFSTGVATDIAYGDLDGDGDLDAFVTRRLAGNLVWKNDGTGSFTSTEQSLGTDDSFAVALADADADGDLDALVANRNGRLQLWRNDGAGNFTLRTELGEISNQRDVAVADLNADGRLDLFGVSQNSFHIWLAASSVHYNEAPAPLGSAGGTAVALADVDADGDVDAFVVTTEGTANQLWINGGNGIFTDSGQGFGRLDSTNAAFADFDHDGDLDLFVTNRAGGNEVWVNDGLGHFAQTIQTLGNGRSTSVALGDVDGDGDLDAVVANDGGQTNQLWLNNGEGFFVDAGITMGTDSSTAVALGDADADGDLDLLVANSFGAGSQFWRNQGPAQPSSADFNSDVVVNRTDLQQWVGDYGENGNSDADGDGDSDGADFLAWQRGYNPDAVRPAAAVSYGADFLAWQRGFSASTDATTAIAREGTFRIPARPIATATTSVAPRILTSRNVVNGELIDAALALIWLEESNDANEAVLENEVYLQSPASHSGPVPITTPPTELAESNTESDSANTAPEDEPIAEPWLPDELLDRIFGQARGG